MTFASIAGCDDYDEIADWGKHHLTFLKGYSEYFFGVPKEDWLRVVLNRIDPALFEACFTAWVTALRPDGADLIALDGKTLRRSGDGGSGTKPIHLVSAWASTQRLVLSQEAVDTKDNECAAIAPDELGLKQALDQPLMQVLEQEHHPGDVEPAAIGRRHPEHPAGDLAAEGGALDVGQRRRIDRRQPFELRPPGPFIPEDRDA